MTLNAGDFSPALFNLLQTHLSAEQVVHTLRDHRPNWIVSISEAGLSVETEKTRAAATGPQLVPTWMFEVAWTRLVRRGRLTNAELVSSDDLNVKRSSVVCAVLAELPRVSVTTTPIVLTYQD